MKASSGDDQGREIRSMITLAVGGISKLHLATDLFGSLHLKREPARNI
jgi:hypothetical protein